MLSAKGQNIINNKLSIINEQSKRSLAEAPKILGLAVWFILAAATCSGVWGYCTEKTICVFATILFAWNVGLIVHYGLKLAKGNETENKKNKK